MPRSHRTHGGGGDGGSGMKQFPPTHNRTISCRRHLPANDSAQPRSTRTFNGKSGGLIGASRSAKGGVSEAGAYASTRLLPVSATHSRSPANATAPPGTARELAVGGFGPEFETKSDWPMTTAAGWPFANGGAYWRMRLFKSTSHRWPLESTVTPRGLRSEAAVGGLGADFERKNGWPMTSEAAWRFEKGGAYLRTRLFSRSATHTLPERSTVTDAGEFSELAVGGAAAAFEVKFVCPRTTEADWPLVNGVLNRRTR